MIIFILSSALSVISFVTIVDKTEIEHNRADIFCTIPVFVNDNVDTALDDYEIPDKEVANCYTSLNSFEIFNK